MKNCKQCSKEFINTKPRDFFCSKPCHFKFIKQKQNDPIRRMTGKIFNCLFCKKEFYIPRWRIKRGDARYCSRSCLAKVHLEQFADKRFKPLGKTPHKYEYIKVNGKQKRLHRHIMEQHLGRKLESWEHVHHIDDDSSNNSLENLVVLSNSEHQKREYEFRKKLLSISSS